MPAELLRLRCRGHPAIRATHKKTLEFTTDPTITARATCVVGVATTVAGTGVPALAGPIRVTVSAAGVSAVIHALANSRWRPGGPAVIRRSPDRLPGTLATDADLSSSDLPRDLVAALTDPAAVVDVTIERATATEPRLIRYRAGLPPDDRLTAEIHAADAVLAEDSAARALLPATVDGPAAAGVLAAGGRVLAVSTMDSPIPEPVRQLLLTRPQVEVLGLPPELAVAAASPHAGPVLLATTVPRQHLPRLAATLPAATVVFRCPATDLPKHLRAAGTSTAAVLPAGLPLAERPAWGPAGDIAGLVSTGDVLCALDPLDDSTPPAALAPAPLLTALLAHGVSPKTLTQAVTDHPGWSRRQAYDYVLDLNNRRLTT